MAVLFLFVHIVDTAIVGWGPEAYDRVESVYQNWFVRLLELDSWPRCCTTR